jgi:hypothetical protein
VRRVSVFFAWYDLWVGAYVDRPNRTLYVCPLPCLVVKILLPIPRPEPVRMAPAAEVAVPASGDTGVEHDVPYDGRPHEAEVRDA